METAKTDFYHNRLYDYDVLHNNDVWKELRSLGHLTKNKENLNGFTCEELNDYFAGVSISPLEDDVER